MALEMVFGTTAAGRGSGRVLPEDEAKLGDAIQRTASVARTISVSSQSHLLGPGHRPTPPPEASWAPGDREEPRHLTWAEDRNAVLSELIFKIDMFCKTCLYEMLPIPLAIIVCTLLDGWQMARNRFSTVFCCIVLPVFDVALQPVIAYVLYFQFSDLLSPSAGYEVLGFVFLPSLARAITLGVKYALYSDLLLSVDQELSLESKEYEKKGCVGEHVVTAVHATSRSDLLLIPSFSPRSLPLPPICLSLSPPIFPIPLPPFSFPLPSPSLPPPTSFFQDASQKSDGLLHPQRRREPEGGLAALPVREHALRRHRPCGVLPHI